MNLSFGTITKLCKDVRLQKLLIGVHDILTLEKNNTPTRISSNMIAEEEYLYFNILTKDSEEKVFLSDYLDYSCTYNNIRVFFLKDVKFEGNYRFNCYKFKKYSVIDNKDIDMYDIFIAGIDTEQDVFNIFTATVCEYIDTFYSNKFLEIEKADIIEKNLSLIYFNVDFLFGLFQALDIMINLKYGDFDKYNIGKVVPDIIKLFGYPNISIGNRFTADEERYNEIIRSIYNEAISTEADIKNCYSIVENWYHLISKSYSDSLAALLTT